MLTESQQVYEPGDAHCLDFWPTDMGEGKCYESKFPTLWYFVTILNISPQNHLLLDRVYSIGYMKLPVI